MTPGSVVSYKNFTFYDGGQSDKLLVVLNSGGSKPYLVLRTTSQPHKFRPPNQGCHSKQGYFFIPKGQEAFRKETWVLLYEPYLINAIQFLQAKTRAEANIVFVLKEDTRRAIINCFKKSEDCSPEHLDLLR